MKIAYIYFCYITQYNGNPVLAPIAVRAYKSDHGRIKNVHCQKSMPVIVH